MPKEVYANTAKACAFLGAPGWVALIACAQQQLHEWTEAFTSVGAHIHKNIWHTVGLPLRPITSKMVYTPTAAVGYWVSVWRHTLVLLLEFSDFVFSFSFLQARKQPTSSATSKHLLAQTFLKH